MFVEKNTKTAGFIQRNIAAVCKSLGREAADLRVINADALTVTPEGAPDLVFIDPPYDLIPEVAPKLFARLAGLLATKPDLLVVFEMPGEMELSPVDWICVKRLGKGARQPTVGIFKAPRAGS